LSIKNINDFWGRTLDPPIFPTKHLRAEVMEKNGKEGKIAASEAPQKRLEWENLIFFAASNANLRLLYI
jgi:hypothetical protein